MKITNNIIKDFYLSLENANRLKEWGVALGDFSDYFYQDGILLPHTQTTLPSYKLIPTLHLLEDICCNKAKEFFPHLTKGQLRTVCTVIMEALENGNKKLAEAEFMENVIFNPLYCRCKSYNCPKSYQTDEEVILSNEKMTGKQTVCIDKCIVEDIKKLWSNDIRTFGCCCGHNGEFGEKSVIVGKKNEKETKKLLPHFEVEHTVFNKDKK